MKVLILSCNTGEGHNSASRAMKEEFDSYNISCEIKDTLSFASKKVSEYISNIYIQMALKAPNLWGSIYNVSKKVSPTNKKSAVYYANSLYANRLYKYITQHNFDAIIMPHLYPGEAISYLNRKYKLKPKLFMVATDYGPVPLFEELDVDYYFIPHKDLKKEYVNRGIDEKKLVVTGIPVSQKFNNRLSKEEARNRIGLPQDRKIALIMTGSMGFGNTKIISDELLEEEPDLIQVILGGNNEELKASLRQEYINNDNIRIIDFTTDVHVYMDAANILFTKPGGLTSTEACVKNIPLVHTHPIPGNEIENAEFFRDHGLSIYNENVEISAKQAVRLLEEDDLRMAMIHAQDSQINADASRDIVRFVIEQTEGK